MLSLGAHQPREARGGDAERERGRPPEDGDARVHRRDVAQHLRVELDVLERLARPRERDLALRRAVGVVERDFGRPALRDLPQVLDREGGRKPALRRVELGALEPDERRELARAGKPSPGHEAEDRSSIIVPTRGTIIPRNARVSSRSGALLRGGPRHTVTTTFPRAWPSPR